MVSWFVWISIFYLAGSAAGIFRTKFLQITSAALLVLSAVFGQIAAGKSLGFVLMTLFPGVLAGRRGFRLFYVEDTERLFPTLYFLSGPLLYFFSFFFYYTIPKLNEYLDLLILPGSVSVLLFLAGEAYQRLKVSDNSGNRIPENISRRSSFSVIIIFLFILLTALVMTVTISDDILTDTAAAIKQFVKWLSGLNLYSRQYSEGEGLPAGEKIPDPEFEDRPFGLTSFIIRFRYIIFVSVIAVFSVILFRLFNKWIRKKKGNIRSGYSDEFDDEIENLFSVKKILRKNFSFRVKKARHSLADPVRRRYRYLIVRAVKNGYPFRKQHTPRETARELERWNEGPLLTDEFIREYEEKRYRHPD